MIEELGARIAERIDALTPPITRRAFADLVGMTPDGLSRALSGQRGISSLELLHISEALDADMHELVTGESNPRQMTLAARHDYDRATSQRSVPSFAEDKVVLEDIRTAYAQSGLPSGTAGSTPTDPHEMRELLGECFPRNFIDRIESNLSADVVRVAELGTAYTATIADRAVIIIPAKGNWFRENWDLAHEIAHLVGLSSEDKANAYAAELLLPVPLLQKVDWENSSQQTIADFLWETGVSTEALRNRLASLRLGNGTVQTILECPTQAFLRRARSWSDEFGDHITKRMGAASTRRFPLALLEAHERKVAAGEISPLYLAWMRGVSEAWIADEVAPHNTTSVADLATALGQKPA